jgi:hypothetical protein
MATPRGLVDAHSSVTILLGLQEDSHKFRHFPSYRQKTVLLLPKNGSDEAGMNRANPILLAGGLVLFATVLSLMTIAQGGLYLAKHEGDVLHFLNLIFRLADGEKPHIDFSTPIGVLAYAPASLFVWLGEGIGHALIHAQILVTAVMLPMIWWVMWTRLRKVAAWFIGIYIVSLLLALTPGGLDGNLSMSMSYNRWAWAATYLVILLSFLPPLEKTRHDWLDGVLIGLLFAVLVLIKMTYVVALFIPVVLALATRGAWKSLGGAALAGLLALGAATLTQGMEFWYAYLNDLITVAKSPIRPQPGETFEVLLGAPEYLTVNLSLLLGIVLLRQGLESRSGLLLLIFTPAFVYITYQNYGNDNHWQMLYFALLIHSLPAANLRNTFGWPLRQAVVGLACAVLAMALPSLFAMSFGPYRHLSVAKEDYSPLLPRAGKDSDILYNHERLTRLDARIALDEPGSALAGYANPKFRDREVVIFQGEKVRDCELSGGFGAWYDALSADLQAAGYASGTKIYEADLLEALWLFGPFGRVTGGSPWFYGGTPGYEDAEFLMVPECPIFAKARKQRLDAITGRGEPPLQVVRKTELYTLYAIP